MIIYQHCPISDQLLSIWPWPFIFRPENGKNKIPEGWYKYSYENIKGENRNREPIFMNNFNKLLQFILSLGVLMALIPGAFAYDPGSSLSGFYEATDGACSCPFNTLQIGGLPYPPGNCSCYYNLTGIYPPCCACPFNTSCSLPQKPVFMTGAAAAFTVNVTSGNAPLSVQFFDLSSGKANAWEWDFGDGTTSDERNPVHVYEYGGTYDITLTVGQVYSQGGFESAISTVKKEEGLISVNGPPRPEPDYGNPLPEPVSVLIEGQNAEISVETIDLFKAGISSAPELMPYAESRGITSPLAEWEGKTGKNALLTPDTGKDLPPSPAEQLEGEFSSSSRDTADITINSHLYRTTPGIKSNLLNRLRT
jgi:PKD repeat protein